MGSENIKDDFKGLKNPKKQSVKAISSKKKKVEGFEQKYPE